MQAQEVMLQAMAKKITWFQAAEIVGIRPAHGGGGNVTRRAGFAGGLTGDEGSLRRSGCPRLCWSGCRTVIGTRISMVICGIFTRSWPESTRSGSAIAGEEGVLQ